MSAKLAAGRTVWQLRDALFDEMEMLQTGKSSPQRAQAVAKLAAQIIESAKLEAIHGTSLTRSIAQKLTLTDRASVSGVPPADEPGGPAGGI